ncbi:MAG: hypothetical protein IJ677_07520 [Alphaproteobacteria bacterium]|nr:hypothetical protein [Alphaproteobacteria bacterium]
MKIRKFILILLPAMLICSVSFAAGLSTKIDYSREIQNIQNKQSKDLRKLKKQNVERTNWDKELRLNDNQKILLQKILKEESAKIDEQMKIIKSAYSEIENIHRQNDEKIRTILTPQQKNKFDTIKYKEKKAKGIKPKEDKPSRKRMSSD